MASCLNICRRVCQFALIVVNILVALLSLAVLIIGIWSKVTGRNYYSIAGSTSDFTQVSVLLIVVGIFLMIVGAIGSVGALFASTLFGRITLGLYAVVLGLLVICEIGGGIAAAVKKGDLETEFRKSSNETFMNYNTDEGANRTWNSFQKSFKCCGVDSYTDYSVYDIFNNNHTVPISCCNTSIESTDCATVTSNLTPEDVNRGLIYTEGCVDAVIGSLRHNLGAIAGGAIVIGLFQIVGVILSCFVALYKPEDKYEVV